MNKYYHLIFPTKGWQPVIDLHLGEAIKERLQRNFHKREVRVLAISYRPDHFHLVIEMDEAGVLSRVIGWCKGECSHYINRSQATKFSWQKGYQFFGFEYPILDKHIRFVKDQDQIHQQRSLQEEIEMMLQEQ